MVGSFDAARMNSGKVNRRNHELKGTRTALVISGLVLAWGYIGYVTWEKITRRAPTQKVVVVKEVVPKIDSKEVLVPVAEIPPGVKLRAEMFTKELRINDKTGSRFISDFQMIRDSYSRAAIAPGLPLLRDYVTSVQPLNTVTAQIPAGYRAVTLKVDALSAVEGWARPGASVDVVWTTDFEGKKITTTIVENCEIISSEQRQMVDAASDGKTTRRDFATLLVKTEDAQKITLAKANGTVTLSLRGDGDEQGLDDRSMTMAQLLRSDVDPQNQRADGMVRIGKSSFTFENGKLVPVDSLIE